MGEQSRQLIIAKTAGIREFVATDIVGCRRQRPFALRAKQPCKYRQAIAHRAVAIHYTLSA
jgi:hypothetical protein